VGQICEGCEASCASCWGWVRVAGGEKHPDALGALGLQREGGALSRPDALPASHLQHAAQIALNLNTIK
jgi:hypothetical protein